MTATSGFQLFGLPHLAAMALTVAIPLLLARIARGRSQSFTDTTARVIAAVLLTNEFLYWGIRIHQIGFDGWVRNHLPLHVCGVAVLLTATTLFFRSEKAYQIVYFWGLAGSANAILTPGGLAVGFPEYRFFQYFIAHSGIVVGVLFATWGFRMRPTTSGLWRAFLYLNLFALTVGGINTLLDSNYMFLSAPPPGTASPFFALPWPWYLPLLEAIGLTMFLLVYSPYPLTRWCRRWRTPD